MQEFSSKYDPKETEEKVYETWEKSGFFNPDVCVEKGVTPKNAEIFSMVLPPPNVTGTLHIGHAFEDTLQDIVVRYARMQGKRTLWIPGTDHAAIATQSKVEKEILKNEGKSRHDLGREAFLRRVNEFAKASHDTIVRQVKRLGSSLDWSREAYTLDEQRNFGVRTAFKKMYDLGLIYRGDRIVNWDPKMQTTVSDDEVEWLEEKIPFYYLKYGPFTIATARPETKFGDKYVVMHPDDERYKKYKDGEKLQLEWINGPVTATVIKDPVIDMEFGTGVMTITPWHDMTDFEIAMRHNLTMEQTIDLNGRLLPIAGEFAGQHIKNARSVVAEKLQKKGLLVKTENNYTHRVATNSRGGNIIEPQIMKQWFVAVNKPFRSGFFKKTTLKELMREAVASGKVRITPERFEKIYFHWIDNLRDWCISRQIWFGHRIPVWYKGEEIYAGIEAPTGEGWEQDPDTLDTWFSSALWPFSTLGWPKETKDLTTYFPNSLMAPGYEILFLWVARMILTSGVLLNEIPFRTVLIHGIVRDSKGRKFSKSLGNGIDPLVLADTYGADALRMALIIGAAPGNDIKFDEQRVKGYRNFSTKIWNIARFISMNKPESADPARVDINNRREIQELAALKKEVTAYIESFDFHLAGEKIYHYIWHTLADKIVEAEKKVLRDGSEQEKLTSDALLEKLFLDSLKLLHPFMPFVTETVWQEFRPGTILMVEKW